MNAYTNTNVSKVAIEACHNNGFSVTSVPAGTANAAYTSLIIDLFRLELEQPSIVVLISGDADYCEVFYWLRQHGYMTVLLYPKDAAASELQSLSDYCFSFETFCRGHRLQNSKKYLRGHPMIRDISSPIFDGLYYGISRLFHFLVQDEKIPETCTKGKKTTVPIQQEDLSQAIHFLRSLGHSVTTSMASSFDQSLHLMRDALNNTIIWPNWEARASSSSQMKVDEDPAARKRVNRGHH
ncbi:putative receptor-like protein kinase [Tanacetum coccineum]